MPQILQPEAEGYAIIGTREPDENQSIAAFNLAFAIAILSGQQVRTGAANGIDEKAMQGTQGRNLAVYLPWASYNRNIIPGGASIIVYSPKLHEDWTLSVKRYHNAYSRLTRGAIALHARNYGIVKGTKAVIAFPDNRGEGGTGQGIRIAKALGIQLIQANRGTIENAAIFIGMVLQQLGFASKDLRITLPGR